MSVNIKQCRKCKRLFQTYGSNICPDCIDQMDKEYLLVKEYIYNNPDADVVEVSEYTGVGKKTILEFLREGRLTIANNDGLLTCIECSKPISVGRYCDDCRSKLEKALNSSVRMEGNRGNSGYGRMHADFMDEDDFRGELK